MKTPRLLCLAALFAAARMSVAVPPTTGTDVYDLDEDATLNITTQFGVLANDDGHGQSIEAVLTVPAAHGTLTLNPDGSFNYTPAPNYNGPDSFSYKARTLIPPVVFNIDQSQSRVLVTGNVHSQYGNPSDNDDSRVGGTMSAVIHPGTTPFTDAHIIDVQAKIIDKIELDFGFGPLGVLGSVSVDSRTVDPDVLTIGMIAPGPAAAVNAAGLFSQPGNTISLHGVVDVSASGIASNFITSGPQALDTTAAIDLNNCLISSNGTTLTLKVPVDYTGRFFLEPGNPNDNYIDLHVQTAFTGSSGYLIATAPASSNISEESLETKVNLTITAVDDPPVGLPESYVARQAIKTSIPATAAQSIQELIASGATWKYRYDGENLGTAWRAWNYNDSGWSSGPALLGFGDPDIITKIRPDGTPNYTTAYFRRDFTVVNLSNSRPGVKLYLKRDDGAVVFVNGVEIYRDSNLPPNAAYGDYATPPRPDTEENIFVEVPVSRTVLFEGRNVVAVEVHQSSASSSDVRFDLRLTRELGAPGVLANDADIDTLPANLTASVLEAPGHGDLVLNANGSFDYTPAHGFTGDDSFVYRVSDGSVDVAPWILLPRGSTWSYLADGSDPGAGWTSAAFNDSAWLSGPAELGYGDGPPSPENRPEATNIRPDPANTPVHPAYFFRTKFTPSVDNGLVTNIVGRILRDDAAAIYLNTREVYRDTNLDSNATFADFATGATPSETEFAEFAIPLDALFPGENTLAVEVHQASAASSDVSFDFEIGAHVVPGARVSLRVLDDDEDDDGISDTWERQHALDYTVAADAIEDSDGDGESNREEFLADTDPHASTSRLAVTQATLAGNSLVLSFSPVSSARTYQLQSSDDLAAWTDFGQPITPTGTIYNAAIPLPAGVAKRYYRLKVTYLFP